MGAVLLLAALLMATFDEDAAASAAQQAQRAERKVTKDRLPHAVDVMDAVAAELRSAVVTVAPGALRDGHEPLLSPAVSTAHPRHARP